MNTGVQRSGATPPAARTATTKPVGDEPGNVFGQGKNAPLIAMAHEIPYVATATVAELRDLEAQGRARDGVPRRALPARLRPLPARLGRRRRSDTIRIARLVKETGLFPVFEAEHGEVVERLEDPPPGPGRGVPEAAAALRAPVRRPAANRRDRADPGDRRPQHPPLRAARRRRQRHDGEALRDHARRRLEPGQQDRHLAHRARRLRRPAAAVQPRLPGRREHPAVALRGRGGRRRLRARLAADHGGQPVPGDHGAGLLPPVRDRLQPRPARRGGRHQLGRALPRRRGDRAGLEGRGRRAAPTGKRVLVVGAGPVRALGRLPPRAARPRRSRSTTPARWPAG